MYSSSRSCSPDIFRAERLTALSVRALIEACNEEHFVFEFGWYHGYYSSLSVKKRDFFVVLNSELKGGFYNV